MSILKQVIHYTDTNTIEATWVDRIQLPDVEVPESFGPTTRGEDGSIIPGELIPAYVVKGGLQDTQVKCHSYADVQMDMLRADAKELGTDLTEHEALIALVESRIVPYVAPEQTPEQIREAKKAHRAEAVASIVVTTSTGKSFDGDELSQGRMSRAILVMQALSAPVTTWVLSDNTPTEVTLAEITEALALAGQEQSRLWVLA